MNKSRLILLGVAAIAGGGAFFMVASGDEPVGEQIAQAVPKDQGPEMVRVLVADQTFGRGDRIDAAATDWVKYPADAVPEHFVTEADEDFYAALGGLRARTTIYEGEPIIAAKTVDQGDKGMMAALLSPGMRAVSVDVGGEATASGFVLPGDVVDLVTTRREGKMVFAETRFTGLRVIAIDQIVQEEGGPGAMTGASVTFELRPDQVEEFIAVREAGQISLVLRSIFDAAVPETRSTDIIVLRYGAAGGT